MKAILFAVFGFAFCLCLYACTDSKASLVDSHPSNRSPIASDPRILPYLREYVRVLENNAAPYDWTDYTRCNVGLMAQVVTQKSGSEIKACATNDFKDYIANSKKRDGEPTMEWRRIINYYCGVTNKPMTGVVGELQKAGFSNEEICQLEFTSNPRICKKAELETCPDYTDKEVLLMYTKAWIALIQEKQEHPIGLTH